ncbi:hypothetical protein AVEN_134427-1 [Araneus ventricosus]|uniref:Secreted protein n=1 Tax=Araneus ventricosus TaxID=182803 RepID=A0A4Y2HV70_ARAVE|nr:hypothetical protein AVEN_134427-1 [Araneus ventricosus]
MLLNVQQFSMLSAFLLFRQKIIALLLPPPHQTSCWLCSSTSTPISLQSTSSPLILAKDTISLTMGSTGYCLRLLNVTLRQHSPTEASSKQK